MNNKELLKQIEDDIGYVNELNPDYSKLEEGWQYWDIGEKIGWCYKDDVKFYMENHGLNTKKDFDSWIKRGNAPYRGILFTLPDYRFRTDENAILCMFDYPIEKDNPTADWISFNRFLEQKDLYKVYKLL